MALLLYRFYAMCRAISEVYSAGGICHLYATVEAHNEWLPVSK